MIRADLIATLGAGRVLVVGDVMLDHYVSGRVLRVSEEAPVPILRVDSERWTAGGAANVAANIVSLGGQAALVGLTGRDDGADRLRDLLGKTPDRLQADLVADDGRATTVKTRYMGGQHQMLRVDRETPLAPSPETEAALGEAIGRHMRTSQGLVLSDYAKGCLTDRVLAQTISAARASGARTIVDPKRTDWSAYRGVDYITPNRRELHLATGIPCDTEDGCDRAARRAMEITGASILLTRSEQGVCLYASGRDTHRLPAKAREVFDVSGAGDTVAATFALAVAAGVPDESATFLANLAAGIVVGKRGTATVTQAECAEALGGRSPRRQALSLEETGALREAWRREGLTVGFANGCFDLIHPGHVRLLESAAAACDRLIVALNSDESVRRLKGPERPLQSQSARAEVIAAVRGVDAVLVFGEDTPLNIIRALRPDLLVKGADYEEKDIVGADIVRADGGSVMRVDLVSGHSTSNLVGRARIPASDQPPSDGGGQG
jgi:D-beta-D-heptose 7-phosphate kinase/D-beta-D-heptose 1-phosphate adenosyltransferase